MCGVVAIASWRGPVSFPIGRALDALAHRGPDDRAHWSSTDGHVTLGHTRLAIRVSVGGKQPLVSEDGKVVAVVNGEIYGAVKLRAELEAAGHRFSTQSDSEIVVHGYEQWGEELVSKLRGELAFALWDAGRNVLFCARDRFGVKPLAWTQFNGAILVASQVTALFAMGVPRAWDHAALLQSASLQYAAPTQTLFRDVRELPAGHVLIARDGDVSVRKYWDLDYPLQASHVSDELALLDVRELLDEAVTERLVSDVPVGFQLSGGLDSAAILACASQSGGSLDAFTVSFTDDSAYDETARARVIAAHLGARLHEVRVSDSDVAACFADAVIAAEGACINAHAAAKLMLSRAIRDAGFKVVLTGEGADEVLFGYAHLRSDIQGTTARVTETNAASAGLMLPDADGLSLAHVQAELGFVPTWMAAKAAFGKRVLALTAHNDSHDPARAMMGALDLDQLRGRGRAEQSAYSWTKLALEGYILRALGDGLEMASSVEGRVPMLDHVLFARLRSLPTNMKIRDGVEKWVLRRAMEGRLPEEVLWREKHPFLAPPIGPHTIAVARDAFASASFRDQPLFDPSSVSELAGGLEQMSPQQRKAYDPVILFALSIATLQSRMGLSS